ncbi:MAG: LptF/LptG family permease [Planctomycetaceae bacterium]|nr:LptF/LptG family permease [Planctomycetaceae bacterium]
MKLLQRYIFGELVRVFTLLVIVLTVMLVFVGVFREATDRGLGPVQILQIMPYVVPSMLPFTIPATLLLSVCVVYGRISGDLEVTAAKAAGVSALQLLSPAFLLGFLLAIASFGLTNFAIPWAVTNINNIVTQAMEDIFLDVLSSQNLINDPQRGYSITVLEVRNRILMDATFRYRTRNHDQITVRAEQAKIHFDLEGQEIKLMLKNATFSRPGSDSSGDVDFHEFSLPLPQTIGNIKARHLTVTELAAGIEKSGADLDYARQQQVNQTAMALLVGDFSQLAGEDQVSYQAAERQAVQNTHRFRSEIHSRMAMSGSCLFFALVGGPFSMLQARRQFITSFIMCFLPILLVYYPVMFLMLNLCKTGTLDPTWSMWVPNLILTVAGTFMLRKVIQY